MTATLDILGQLVAFDTTSRNSNLPLIEWVTGYLDDHGVESRVLSDASGEKANLVASLGPAVAGGVVLCGHTDVVPTDSQPWTRDPFTLARDGSRAYGRGTADMKGFIASALAAVPRMKAGQLRRPIVLAFSHDEETGCLGAPSLADALVADGPPPIAVVTGEPTEMRVVRAHKGIRAFRTTVNGRDGHSSRTDVTASAVMAAARIVTFVEELAERLSVDGVRVPGFLPQHTTMSVGQINGGTAINIVPRRCEVGWEYRRVPGEDVDGICDRVAAFVHDVALPRLQRVAPEASIATETIVDVPALDAAGNDEAAAFVRDLTGAGDGDPVAYSTDGAVLQARGLPTVVCGPGSIAQGHQPDEFIEVAELERCDRFMDRLAEWATG